MDNGSTSLRVGLIGAGYISAAYLHAAQFFDQIEFIACADLNAATADARAREFGLKSTSVEALLEDDSLELVLNLTIPQAHAPVGLRALGAGKHVYSEKPLALSAAEAQALLVAARSP